MKYIIVGDTHIGVKQSSHKYHGIINDLFVDICDFAKTRGIHRLIQVGDMFDNRKALSQTSIDCALSVADMVSTSFARSYFIVGNHDTPSKDTMFPHSLIIFKKYQNITIVDKPTMIDDAILSLPWMFDIDDMVDARICIGHFDINGAMMNSSGTTSRNHRLNFSDFSKYELTLSGHYHTPNKYNHNVMYIGSPYQITFNDMSSKRGFYVLDTDDLGMEFVEFCGYPHHLSFTDKSRDIGDIEGNIVRLVFTEDHGIDGNKEIIQRYKGLNPHSLRIKYARVDDTMTDEEIHESVSIKSKIDVLHDFYDKSDLPDNINPILLKRVSESIYKEMLDV